MLAKLLSKCAALAAGIMLAVLTAALPASAQQPDRLSIAVILSAGIENGWDGTFIKALERAKEAAPHGLNISWKYTDPLWGDDAGDAMRLFAESGEYDIIWAHSTYSDQVKKLKDEFPEILFVVVGSGNEGLGGNQYWVYKRVHEPAYVLGTIAGKMTKTGVVGAVGTFPADDVNDEINAFFAGAKSVRPDIKHSVAFIESWYDPAKAAEYTKAQIATGADFILQLANNFQPCEEAKIYCFGNFSDQNSFAPKTVLSSTVAVWDPDLNWIINAWYAHKTEGKAYDGNKEKHWFPMAEGGSAVAPFHELESAVPEAVRAEAKALEAKIMDGSLKVPLEVSEPKTTTN